MSALKGRCLCGAVRFTATPGKIEMDACHCGMCRRWSAGPAMTVGCSSLTIEDEAALGVYASSEWAERCFCKSCGSTLFWRMRDGSLIAVSAHAFDDPSRFPFEVEIYVDEKPSNYAFANPTRKMTGAEVIAAFAGKSGAGDHG